MKSHAVRLALSALTLSALFATTACTPQGSPDPASTTGNEEEPMEATADTDEFVSTAMVVLLGNGEPLFIDQDTESPYYPTLPEGAPELKAGNVVRVTGNGIMLQSYPAQYPGITKVEVIEEGTPEDAEKYAELVSQLWQPKDAAEPAFATLEYTTELAATSVMLSASGYSWSYEQDGESLTDTVDAPDPLSYAAGDLPDARVDGPTEATVSFDVTPTGVTVTSYSEDKTSSTRTDVPVELAGGAATLTIEPGNRYVVNATFEAGEVSYVFVATAA